MPVTPLRILDLPSSSELHRSHRVFAADVACQEVKV